MFVLEFSESFFPLLSVYLDLFPSSMRKHIHEHRPLSFVSLGALRQSYASGLANELRAEQPVERTLCKNRPSAGRSVLPSMPASCRRSNGCRSPTACRIGRGAISRKGRNTRAFPIPAFGRWDATSDSTSPCGHFWQPSRTRKACFTPRICQERSRTPRVTMELFARPTPVTPCSAASGRLVAGTVPRSVKGSCWSNRSRLRRSRSAT